MIKSSRSFADYPIAIHLQRLPHSQKAWSGMDERAFPKRAYHHPPSIVRGAAMGRASDFGTFGRFVERPVADMPTDVRDACEFTKQLRGLALGQHRIWLANPALSKTIVPTGEYYQKHSTLTRAEIEIVTNLVNARWRSAYASYEHEKIDEEQGFLDPEKVQRMIVGLPVTFDDPREDSVSTVALALVQPRPVALGLYR